MRIATAEPACGAPHRERAATGAAGWSCCVHIDENAGISASDLLQYRLFRRTSVCVEVRGDPFRLSSIPFTHVNRA